MSPQQTDPHDLDALIHQAEFAVIRRDGELRARAQDLADRVRAQSGCALVVGATAAAALVLLLWPRQCPVRERTHRRTAPRDAPRGPSPASALLSVLAPIAIRRWQARGRRAR